MNHARVKHSKCEYMYPLRTLSASSTLRRRYWHRRLCRRKRLLHGNLIGWFRGQFHALSRIQLGNTRQGRTQVFGMKESYLEALAYESTRTEERLFTRLYGLFVREPETNTGLGAHFLVDLVETTKGSSGRHIITVFCENHDIPIVFEERRPNDDAEPIRDIVKRILVTSPPRCAIVLDTRENELLQKVRTRIARTHCDLRYRRVIFCLTDHDMPAGTSCASLHVPGTTHDKMTMLLYHIPAHIRKQAASLDRFLPLADSMVDYSLFQPRIWRNVSVEGTIDEFLSTAQYQIVRRVCSDPGVGDSYPSFETEWRSEMATRLKQSLVTPPEALCPSIHRVIPIGVLPQDALQAMQVAIPTDIQIPYAITVQSSAVDDQCGSIAITQPKQHTVVHVHCTLDSGLLVDVCRELRAGHRAVVSEVHSIQGQLTDIRDEIKILVNHLSNKEQPRPTPTTSDLHHHGQCSKRTCSRVVTKRFRSGKLHRQCNVCIDQCNVRKE